MLYFKPKVSMIWILALTAVLLFNTAESIMATCPANAK